MRQTCICPIEPYWLSCCIHLCDVNIIICLGILWINLLVVCLQYYYHLYHKGMEIYSCFGEAWEEVGYHLRAHKLILGSWGNWNCTRCTSVFYYAKAAMCCFFAFFLAISASGVSMPVNNIRVVSLISWKSLFNYHVGQQWNMGQHYNLSYAGNYITA